MEVGESMTWKQMHVENRYSNSNKSMFFSFFTIKMPKGASTATAREGTEKKCTLSILVSNQFLDRQLPYFRIPHIGILKITN